MSLGPPKRQPCNMNNERACPTPELLRHVKMSGNDNKYIRMNRKRENMLDSKASSFQKRFVSSNLNGTTFDFDVLAAYKPHIWMPFKHAAFLCRHPLARPCRSKWLPKCQNL